MARKQHVYLLALLAILILAGLCLPTAPSLAQEIALANMLCVKAPASIAKGDTEILEISIIPAGEPLPSNEEWLCEATAVYPEMGVGVAGVRISNFVIDPEEKQVMQNFDPTLNNEWVWFMNAIGDEDSTHNMIIYSYVEDAEIRAGYRVFTRIPIRVEIASKKSTMEQLGESLKEFRELIVLASAAVLALITLRGQISKLLGSDKKANENEKA